MRTLKFNMLTCFQIMFYGTSGPTVNNVFFQIRTHYKISMTQSKHYRIETQQLHKNYSNNKVKDLSLENVVNVSWKKRKYVAEVWKNEQ